jgi:hypothetical protein
MVRRVSSIGPAERQRVPILWIPDGAIIANQVPYRPRVDVNVAPDGNGGSAIERADRDVHIAVC